jgi:hypothetical protein
MVSIRLAYLASTGAHQAMGLAMVLAAWAVWPLGCVAADPISPPVKTVPLSDAESSSDSTSPPPADPAEAAEPALPNASSSVSLVTQQIPVGMPLQVVLETPVTTATQTVGQPIEASLLQPIYVGGQVVFGIQTKITGVIDQIEPPLSGRNAVLRLYFNRITLDDGSQLPLAAHVKTANPDHTWGGELTLGTIPEKVTMRVTGIGEYNKTVMRGPRLMGKPIELPPGERLTLILDQPLSVVTPKDVTPIYPMESFETRFPTTE